MTPEDEAKWEAARKVSDYALVALAETPPHTIASLLAALDYFCPYAMEQRDAAKALDRFIQIVVANAGLLEA